MQRSGKDVLAILCLIGSIVCWGVPPIMLRYLVQHIPDGFTTNAIRYPISTLVYIPLLIAAHRRGLRLGSFWTWALLPAVVNIVGQTLFAIAPYHMEAGLMSFLLRLSTIWSILLAFVIFRDERILMRSLPFWLAVSLSLIGFVLMALIGRAGDSAGPPVVTFVGIAIILVCSIFWGLYDVTVRHTMGLLHPLVVFGVIGNYTSIGLILLAPLGQPRSILHLSPGALALLIVSAYIGIAAAHGMYYVALQRLGVAISSITLLLSPFVTILGSALFLGECFTAVQWAGGLVLTAGATLALWTRYQLRRVSPAEEAVTSPVD
jgi:drug/metabolite transporter (DMT)-like permease